MSAHRLELVLELNGPKVPISKVREIVDDHLDGLAQQITELCDRHSGMTAAITGEWKADSNLHDRKRKPHLR